MTPRQSEPPRGSRLARALRIGLLVLLALMPLHAFLSVWLGSLFGHQAVFQAWKEVLLAGLAVGTMVLLYQEPQLRSRLRARWVLAAGGFGLVALLVTLLTAPGLSAAAFGIKTDLEFLAAAVIAAVLATPVFVRRAAIIILAGAAVVCGFGLLQIYALPPDFLTQFGYGPSTIVPYQTITDGSKALRFPATLGGPNQLGTYLILPLCLSLAIALRRRRWWLLLLTAAAFVVLFNTQSRSAWIGAVLAATATVVAVAPARRRRPLAWGVLGAALIALAAIPVVLQADPAAQYYLLHSSVAQHDTVGSDSERLGSLRRGLQAAIAAPLGHGLGTAGPATFRTGVGNIFENYYLQLAYETGLIGLLAFLSVVGLIIRRLARLQPARYTRPAAAAVIGISVVALALPAWTDSSTSLILWTFAGSLAGGDPHV